MIALWCHDVGNSAFMSCAYSMLYIMHNVWKQKKTMYVSVSNRADGI